VNTIAGELTAHRFFADLPPDSLEVLAGCGRNVLVPQGDVMIREGAPADVFWAIRDGRVALGLTVPGRGLVTLETLHAGDVLGWSWLFPPYRWHFEGEALDEVRAVQFDAGCLRQKCEADTVLGFQLAKRFARVIDERLQATRLQLMDLYGHPVAR
jgi:CRP/FNR family cyclic AMP-dependent transcriptional regulator